MREKFTLGFRYLELHGGPSPRTEIHSVPSWGDLVGRLELYSFKKTGDIRVLIRLWQSVRNCQVVDKSN